MRRALKETIEYALARTLLTAFQFMPRSVAHQCGRTVAWLGFHLASRQRRAAFRNLEIAMPDLSAEERERIVRGVFRNLGRLLVEFARFPTLNRSNIENLVVYKGLEHFKGAVTKGCGTIILTGHIGAWELSVFAHSVYGHRMKFLSRPIDNPRVDALITRWRTLQGNVPIEKHQATREVLRALRSNEVVGILADQNTVREEAVFVPFFGTPAATTKGVAMFALRTGATVIPGYLLWDPESERHQLCFEPPIEAVNTGNLDHDVEHTTARYNAALERVVRAHPDQWLWIHRRWKTRPEGEPALY